MPMLGVHNLLNLTAYLSLALLAQRSRQLTAAG